MSACFVRQFSVGEHSVVACCWSGWLVDCCLLCLPCGTNTGSTWLLAVGVSEAPLVVLDPLGPPSRSCVRFSARRRLSQLFKFKIATL